MPESLLTPSRILLFGRKMEDLQIVQPSSDKSVRLATTKPIVRSGVVEVDGYITSTDNRILVKNPPNNAANGIYVAKDGDWDKPGGEQVGDGKIVYVEDGIKNGGTFWMRDGDTYRSVSRGKIPRIGKNNHLAEQIDDTSCLARIYGFSYEGTYYDLPRPTLFLVHGPGTPAVQSSQISGASNTVAQLARAPREPSTSGVAAADFGIADDIMVWSYDKADYTIRMDVETGMFEQVLLDMYFDGGGGVSGARVSGARVSGARVSGARVSGARVSGARVGGPRGDGSD